MPWSDSGSAGADTKVPARSRPASTMRYFCVLPGGRHTTTLQTYLGTQRSLAWGEWILYAQTHENDKTRLIMYVPESIKAKVNHKFVEQ